MISFCKAIDRHYSLLLKEYSIQSRPGAGNGLWTVFLLPMIFSHSAGQAEWRDTYRNVVSLSCWFTVILLGLFPRQLLVRPGRYTQVITLVFVLLLSLIARDGAFTTVKVIVVSISAFWSTIQLLVHQCSKSFTLGEAAVVSQGIAIAFSSIFYLHASAEDYVLFGESLLVGVSVFVALVSSVQRLRQPLFFCGGFLGTAVATLGLAAVKLDQNPVFWLYKFIVGSRTRVLLIGYWVFCTTSSIGIVALQNAWKPQRELTIIRKYFHGVVVAVCLPGILLDLKLLYVASTVALGAFVFLECVRLCNIPPFGNLLNSALSSLLDEKDQGVLILTHVYLLIGCCLPFWLLPTFPSAISFQHFLLVSSGVITLGIGDAAASIGGTLFGRTKWPGSSKSLEGTACSIAAQLLFGYVISIAGLIHSGSFPWTKFIVATVGNSVTEALTTQVDNLVLPLVMYIAMAF